MTTGVASEPTPVSLFIVEMRKATCFEELKQTMNSKPEDLNSSQIVDESIRLKKIFMRQKIGEIKTPEDVLKVHNYFKEHQFYSRDIQRELGQWAYVIIGKWKPAEYAVPQS